jgi:branched-chain amino acid transport system ATP-binding protein
VSLLQVEDLVTRYGEIEALHGVSFAVEKGEIVALIGANGAGKSTTLMTISGILRPAKGKVTFDGREIQGLPAHEIVSRGVRQCPEGRRIFTRMTVEENLLMGAFGNKNKAEVAALKENVCELFPILRERIRQVGDTLSGGEQQMLAIARALMGKPRLLLLDEPSLGLAPLLVERVFETIRKIRDSGTTVLLVEQNARAALDMADRAYVLEVGTVALQGTGKELLGNPAVQRAYLGGSCEV